MVCIIMHSGRDMSTVGLKSTLVYVYKQTVSMSKLKIKLYDRIHLERIAVAFALTKCRLSQSDSTDIFGLPDVV